MSKAKNYRHTQKAVSRPDVGLQDKFYEKRKPKTYRYDSRASIRRCPGMRMDIANSASG